MFELLFFIYLMFFSVIVVSIVFKLYLTFIYIFKVDKKTSKRIKKLKEIPFISIQVPIYNELYVIKRVLKAVTSIDWDKEKLEIQVLDDSDDITSQIIKKEITKYQQQGVRILHLQRANRKGFKAGALALAHKTCKGEFIALFDADFIPPKNFLQKTIPHFANPKLGVVQSRWGYTNRNYSLLTRLQAMILDVHFRIEQSVRSDKNFFVNFNGTAGVIRRSCLDDVGGWLADTLTEDLDLSYRTYLKGWKILYLENVECSAELPITMQALKIQQFRWVKGTAECSKKFFIPILKKKNIPLKIKITALFPLINSFVFVSIFFLILLSLPLVLLEEYISYYIINLFRFFLLTYAVFIVYLVPYIKVSIHPKKIFLFFFLFPFFLSITTAMSFYNAVAALEGYFQVSSSFIRTPKFNSFGWKKNKYTKEFSYPTFILTIEILLLIYTLVGVYQLWSINFYLSFFYICLAFGFSYSIFFILKQKY